MDIYRSIHLSIHYKVGVKKIIFSCPLWSTVAVYFTGYGDLMEYQRQGGYGNSTHPVRGVLYLMSSGPPQFIVAFANLTGLHPEEIRLSKRNEPSPALEKSLDSCLYKLCGLPGPMSNQTDIVGTISMILISLGYKRCWCKSVQERLYAITWMSIISNFWGRRLTQEIYHTCATFANISNLWHESTFRLRPSFHPNKTVTSSPAPSLVHTDAHAQRHAITSLYGSINQKLKIFRSLDEIRCRLLSKIASKLAEEGLESMTPSPLAGPTPKIGTTHTHTERTRMSSYEDDTHTHHTMTSSTNQRSPIHSVRNSAQSDSGATSTHSSNSTNTMANKLLHLAPVLCVSSELWNEGDGSRGVGGSGRGGRGGRGGDRQGARQDASQACCHILEEEVTRYDMEVTRVAAQDTASRIKFLEWLGRSVSHSTSMPHASRRDDPEQATSSHVASGSEDDELSATEQQYMHEAHIEETYFKTYTKQHERMTHIHTSNCDVKTDISETCPLRDDLQKQMEASMDMVAVLESSVSELLMCGRLQRVTPPPPPAPVVKYKPFSSSPVRGHACTSSSSGSSGAKKSTAMGSGWKSSSCRNSGMEKEEGSRGGEKEVTKLCDLEEGYDSTQSEGEMHGGLSYLKRCADEDIIRHMNTFKDSESEMNIYATALDQRSEEESESLVTSEHVREVLIQRQLSQLSTTTSTQQHHQQQQVNERTHNSPTHESISAHRKGISHAHQQAAPADLTNTPSNKRTDHYGDGNCSLCLPTLNDEDYLSAMRSALSITTADVSETSTGGGDGRCVGDRKGHNEADSKDNCMLGSARDKSSDQQDHIGTRTTTLRHHGQRPIGDLQDVSTALEALRGHHVAMLGRTAKATEKYSPYEFVNYHK